VTGPSRNRERYWRRNLRYVAALLGVWFVVSFGCGVVFADALDAVRIGGFKLGFWMSQQGSIYVFVALIFVYVRLMNRLDAEFDVHETPGDAPGTSRVVEPGRSEKQTPPSEKEPPE
jgi:putative solute:sodium symporter small subunit